MIKADLQYDSVMQALADKAARFPHISQRAAMRGASLVEGFAKREGFRTQGDVIGTKTTKSGKKINKYGALGKPIADKLTSRTGALRSSIQVTPAPALHGALVGPSVVYGAIHEFGGEIKMGARSWMGGFTRSSKRSKGRTNLGSYRRRHSIQAHVIRIPPRPYMRPAFYNHQLPVKKAMMRELIIGLGLQAGA